MDTLLQKLVNKTAAVAVVGLGYVGLPLAVELHRAGYLVIGVEIDSDKVALLMQGRSYVTDIGHDTVSDILASGRFRATSDFSRVSEADAVVICVPTPLRKTKDPDISFVKNAVERVAQHVSSNTLVVLESTTYPGTTEELVVPILERGGRIVGRDLYVAFSPERVDPGNQVYTTRNTPKVVGGITPRCTEVAKALYTGAIDQVHAVGSANEAEMVKLLENTFRAVNIALVNELLLMCDRMDIDIWRVVDAAATKPFGFMPFYPGPGIGGHCIPIDPMYLSWKAKTYDFFNRFIELATDINGNMPRFVVTKLLRVFNDRRKVLNGSHVLIVGVSYKPDVTDTRESPGLEIFKLLQRYGAHVNYHDPWVPEIAIDGVVHHSVPLDRDTVSTADCVLIATSHRQTDYSLIAREAPLVFDTRNALAHVESPNIVRL